MWGCIGPWHPNPGRLGVPSLYVRVYRLKTRFCRRIWSSLTVCEGVSMLPTHPGKNLLFPHCMWGCIEAIDAIFEDCKVPSLYVRVYRSWITVQAAPQSSLIICEGVSMSSTIPIFWKSFPHYMWGCIGICKKASPREWIPSPCVRVYRNLVYHKQNRHSFLIVCEGIPNK